MLNRIPSDKRYEEFKARKRSADLAWDRELERALNGKIDREALIRCILLCNMADAALIDHETKHRSPTSSQL